MKKTLMVIISLLLAASCRTTSRPQTDNAKLAAEIFDMKFDPSTKSIEAGNMSGLRTDNDLFSHRKDSRTYFMYDAARANGTGPLFEGTDDELLALASAVLERAGIPKDEVASARVLQERRGVGAFDRTTHVLINREETKGKRYALLTREVAGIPVVSSRLLLTAGSDKRASFAEVHWPVISKAVVGEARRLQGLVRQGWKPPQENAARPETIEAVIVHSPAAAMVMDIRAVIRVIYASPNEKASMKGQRFFDGDGRAVDPPRTFEKMYEVPQKTRPTQGKP
jgi:hypothetical protein